MRVFALVKRICRQLLRDKRTLAMLFLAPVLVLSLMFIIFNADAAKPRLAAVGIDEGLSGILGEHLEVIPYDKITHDMIKDERLDGALVMESDGYHLILENGDPAKSNQLHVLVNQGIGAFQQQKMMPNPSQTKDIPEKSMPVDTTYVYGNADTRFFDVLSPVLIGFFAFLFVFLISGVGLLRERTTGTLERLLSTPIRRSEVVLGYLIGYGMFAVLQTLVIIFYSITVFDLTVAGSIGNVLLVNLLVALVALTLGILLSTFASSEFQMIQFIPLVVVPQIFFTGIFPLDGMAEWLRLIGRIMPLYYASEALKGVMYQGFTLADIWLDVVVLSLFALLFIVLNIFGLKRHRAL